MRLKISMQDRSGGKKAKPLRYLIGNIESFLKGESFAFLNNDIKIMKVGSHIDKIFFIPVLVCFDREVILRYAAGLAISNMI
jgi:hypothetical protein